MANKKPTLKYFHVFGGKCFVLKDGEHLGKFDAKADEGIFLGYSLESKSYRVYVIEHQKVIESLNVTFDDTKLPSLQKEKDSDILEFENMMEYNIGGEDKPVVVTGNNGNNDDGPDSSTDNGGNSSQTQSDRSKIARRVASAAILERTMLTSSRIWEMRYLGCVTVTGVSPPEYYSPNGVT
ncbi:hypothetical protein ACR2XN_28780 [Klebsiella pneumoniae]